MLLTVDHDLYSAKLAKVKQTVTIEQIEVANRYEELYCELWKREILAAQPKPHILIRSLNMILNILS